MAKYRQSLKSSKVKPAKAKTVQEDTAMLNQMDKVLRDAILDFVGTQRKLRYGEPEKKEKSQKATDLQSSQNIERNNPCIAVAAKSS